jgi:hypothetical protein
MEIWMPLNLLRLKLTGDLLGQLLSTTVNSSNSLLTALGSNHKFIDVSKINLNEKLRSPGDGKVNVKPFDIKYKDIKATIGNAWF